MQQPYEVHAIATGFCPLQIGSANGLLLALGFKFRHVMDSVVLRRLQPINPCYGNLIWEMTQMFAEGLGGRPALTPSGASGKTLQPLPRHIILHREGVTCSARALA